MGARVPQHQTLSCLTLRPRPRAAPPTGAFPPSISPSASDVPSDAPGSKIVGSSLSQVQDPEACEMFSAMAVAAEDVPLPMVALELVWCAKKGLSPPIGRFGLVKLRKHVFQLLDRNLVLGETTTGVYMHDVSLM